MELCGDGWSCVEVGVRFTNILTISYLHKNILIPLLCQCDLFIHTCVSKYSIVSKDMIFYLLRYNVIR